MKLLFQWRSNFRQTNQGLPKWMKIILIIFIFGMAQNGRAQLPYSKKVFVVDSSYSHLPFTFQKQDGYFIHAYYSNIIGDSVYLIHFIFFDSTGTIIQDKSYSARSRNLIRAFDLTENDQLAATGYWTNGPVLMTFDANANMISASQYLLSGEFNFVTHTPDSHYLLCGQSQSANGLIMETDFAGNQTFIKSYVINNHKTNFLMALPLKNSHRFYAGVVDVVSPMFTLNPQLALLETDSLGNVFWNSQIGDLTLQEAKPKAIIELEDSSIIIFANTRTNIGAESVLVLKLSSSRQIIWHKLFYAGVSIFRTSDALLKSDGIINFSGYKTLTGGGSKSFICSMDTSGALINTVQFGDSCGENNLLQCSNKNLFCITSGPSSGGYARRSMLMTDSSLNFLCNGLPFNITLNPYSLYDSTGYTVVNTTAIVSPIPLSVFSDTIFSHTEYDDCNATNLNETPGLLRELTAYFSGDENSCILSISFSAIENVKLNITLSDISGRILHIQPILTSVGLNKIQIPVKNISPGIYLVSLNGAGNMTNIKLYKN